MKKTFALWIILLTICTLLIACEDTVPSDTTPTTDTPPAETTPPETPSVSTTPATTTPAETTSTKPTSFYNPETGVITPYLFKIQKEFDTLEFTDSNGFTLPYRLYLPPNHNENDNLPVLLYLHGMGRRGNDNFAQLDEVWTMFRHTDSPAYFSIVVAPQCPKDQNWSGQVLNAVAELLDYINSTYSTDNRRQYVVGSSMGGTGVWNMIKSYPYKVSAAVPVAGTGPIFVKGAPAGLTKSMFEIPICLVYDETDPYSDGAYNEKVYNALVEGGNRNVRTYKTTGLGHSICSSFVTTNDVSVLTWLFEQKRETNVQKGSSGVSMMDRAFLKNQYTASNGITMGYRLYIPEDLDEVTDLPLLVYLHTENTRGNDNMKHLEEIDPFFESKASKAYGSVVLVPQCPEGYTWEGATIDALIELIEHVEAVAGTNPKRHYVVGKSMGTTGVWDMMTRYPDKVTAVLLINCEGIPLLETEDGKLVPEGMNDSILNKYIRFVYEPSVQAYNEKLARALFDNGATNLVSEAVSSLSNGDILLFTKLSTLYYFITDEALSLEDIFGSGRAAP